MKIEFILKESTKNEISTTWADSGREDNVRDGGFIFENASEYTVKDGVISIHSDGSRYYYNISDFYRIKLT